MCKNHAVCLSFSPAPSIGAARFGRGLLYPSSKTCHGCGVKVASLPLSVRAWTCEGCGANHDRDLNAAKNILAEGLNVWRGLPHHAGMMPCPALK